MKPWVICYSYQGRGAVTEACCQPSVVFLGMRCLGGHLNVLKGRLLIVYRCSASIDFVSLGFLSSRVRIIEKLLANMTFVGRDRSTSHAHG